MKFGTKGETLLRIKDKLRSAIVPDLMIVSRSSFSKTLVDFQRIRTLKKSSDSKFAVRSSFKSEDSSSGSNAGRYLSLLDLELEEVFNAIQQVFASNTDNPLSDDQVIIQEMLSDVFMSGVVLTRDKNTGAQYRTLEFSYGSDTSVVTSGKANNIHQYIYWNNVREKEEEEEISLLKDLVEELEQLFDQVPIDFEFAFSRHSTLPFLLQVRPLIINNSAPNLSVRRDALESRLWSTKERLTGIFSQHPLLLGQENLLGNMPDWNPAEIIGIKPKPLALSLYQDLITDGIWAYQRHNYGYRNLRSFPLMITVAGQPYIDVRVSFNSFVPQGISDIIGQKLVDGYLRKLKQNPELHDKVEFEIVISCLTLDFDEKIESLLSFGLTQDEIVSLKGALKSITNRVLIQPKPIWIPDQDRISLLSERRLQILQSSLQPLEKVYWLLEDCKRYGTLPFAGLARAAFISTQMLRSMIRCDIISQDQTDYLFRSNSTVAGILQHQINSSNMEEVLSVFGHLRPGTYEISRESYREAPEKYFPQFNNRHGKTANYSPASNVTTPLHLNFDAISKSLLQRGFEVSSEDFIQRMLKTITLRESSKLEFSKNLSAALDLLAELGESLDISRDEMSFTDVLTIKRLRMSTSSINLTLRESINKNRTEYYENFPFVLPNLISAPSDILAFRVEQSKGNYVTTREVTAKVLVVSGPCLVDGYIVLLERADPGYDWIFTQGIKGIITAFGGANSHMAVRSSEFGIPAAIGIGTPLFSNLVESNMVTLDCANREIRIIR